jgi:peptidyl-prolyl cis-trans isomerase SurA
MPSLSAAQRGAAAVLALAVASSLAVTARHADAATTVDRIVAQVNRNVITLSELEARLATLSPAQRAALSGAGDVERQVLEFMIDEELVNQSAQKIGLAVSEAEVDDAIKSLMEERKLNDSQLRQALAASGTNLPAFRAQLRAEILKNKVLSYSVMNRIVVTEQEVTDFLGGRVPTGAQPVLSASGVSDFDGVRIIFLPSNPAQAPRVLASAARIKAEIDAGLPFSEAAAKYSKGPGADNGGDPGNLVVQDLQPELRQLARQLVPGRVSEPLNGGDVVLLITVVSAPSQETANAGEEAQSSRRRRGTRRGSRREQPAEQPAYSEEQRAGARRQLEQMKMRRKYDSWIAELRSNAAIKITL